MKTEIAPDGPQKYYTYDRGLLISITHEEKVNGEARETTLGCNATYSFSYDKKRHCLSKSIGDKTTHYTYDTLGNILTIDDGVNKVEYVYDINANVLLERLGSESVSYAYNTDGTKRFIGYADAHYRLVRDESGNLVEICKGLESYALKYDPLGNQTSLTYPNRLSQKSQFDPLGRIVKRSLGENESLTYTYDKSSRIVMKNTTPYRYDEAGRVVSAGDEDYHYDEAGNLLRGESTIDSVSGRLMRQGEVAFSYDPLGRLIVKRSPITQSIYSYDAEGYLVRYVKTPVRPEETKNIVELRFTYDPLGRRLTKHFKSFVVSLSNHETINKYHHRYLYAGDNIVAIYDADTDELIATLLHDEGIDTPLSISVHPATPLSSEEQYHYETLDETEQYLFRESRIQTYYYHRDHQNSILSLTDKESKIVESYSYDAYGKITHSTKSVETYNPYGYTGREIDADDLYYYRARYYDPTIGRFITPDPIGFMGGDTNFYRYIGNDPVNFTDPSGLLGTGIAQNYSQNALSSQQGTQRFGGQTLVDVLRGSANRQHTSSRPIDGVMVRNTQPEVQQVTHGYFYDYEGKFLGNNGTENVVYAADAKASSTEYTNPIKLVLTHTELQTASAIVKHEGITNDKKEYLWIAHASKNAADNSGTTIYGKLMSSYSSVPNGEKSPLPTTSNSARSNYARAGVIHALLKEDPTNGASLWDGTDFLAWGLHSPNGTPQNKFEEYKAITIDVGIYDTFLSNTLLAYPNHSVNYYGQPYNIPDEVFTDPSNWTVDKFIYNTNQNAPKSLTATGTAGRSIFWRKH